MFIEKEQDWENETTRYWFHVYGVDYGTGYDFGPEFEEYAIAESCGFDEVLDCDGYPLTESDHRTIAVRNQCKVTDEMRNDH